MSDARTLGCSPIDLAWLAGLLEGEGTFTIRRPKRGRPTARMKLAMTDEDVVRRARDTVRMGTLHGPYVVRAGCKPHWEWVVARKADVITLLSALSPLMGSRRQARIAECLAVANRVGRSGISLASETSPSVCLVSSTACS